MTHILCLQSLFFFKICGCLTISYTYVKNLCYIFFSFPLSSSPLVLESFLLQPPPSFMCALCMQPMEFNTISFPRICGKLFTWTRATHPWLNYWIEWHSFSNSIWLSALSSQGEVGSEDPSPICNVMQRTLVL